MGQSDQQSISRRNFMVITLPVCIASCLVSRSKTILAQTLKEESNQTKQKFDKVLDRKFTLAGIYALRFRAFIDFAKDLEKEWGKEQLIAFLKKNAEQKSFEHGQKRAKELGDNSFTAYKKPYYSNQSNQQEQTFEIVEDTDTVFQKIITECIVAKTYIDAGAGDIGYAHHCYSDYGWIKGFNSNIILVRDKTLMQGHDCCNFRYIILG